MNTFGLIITAYNSIIFKGQSVYCGVKTPAGSLGLEARHESVLSVLKKHSEIHYKSSSGEEKTVKIRDGMLSFKNNKCVITVSLPE